MVSFSNASLSVLDKVVVKDAVGDRATAPHEANLYNMSEKYADSYTTEEAVNWFASIG